MKSLIHLKTTTLSLLTVSALGCFAVLPRTLALVPPPDGDYAGANTAEGDGALNSLHPNARGAARDNTALGFHTLYSDTTGSNNTATGANALLNNNGNFNTATGSGALFHNTTDSNTADGYQALYENKTGSGNVAIGAQALNSNTQGLGNVAVGANVLSFVGASTLGANVTGNFNTAVGWLALSGNITGSDNVAVGVEAGKLSTGDSNIDIGHPGVAGESHTIRIGGAPFAGPQTACYIAGISGQTASGGAAVYINSDGKLGTSNSSIRFKDAIKPMDKASEAILALKPVTFHYKKELDPKTIPQFGLVAEDVAKVNPDLVARDAQGKVYTVRYEAVNAMLLNEFLKEHRKVEEQDHKIQEQEATIAQLKSDFRVAVTQLTARLKEQAAQVQKVSAQLELSKPPAQATVNNQ